MVYEIASGKILFFKWHKVRLDSYYANYYSKVAL